MRSRPLLVCVREGRCYAALSAPFPDVFRRLFGVKAGDVSTTLGDESRCSVDRHGPVQNESVDRAENELAIVVKVSILFANARLGGYVSLAAGFRVLIHHAPHCWWVVLGLNVRKCWCSVRVLA